MHDKSKIAEWLKKLDTASVSIFDLEGIKSERLTINLSILVDKLQSIFEEERSDGFAVGYEEGVQEGRLEVDGPAWIENLNIGP